MVTPLVIAMTLCTAAGAEPAPETDHCEPRQVAFYGTHLQCVFQSPVAVARYLVETGNPAHYVARFECEKDTE